MPRQRNTYALADLRLPTWLRPVPLVVALVCLAAAVGMVANADGTVPSADAAPAAGAVTGHVSLPAGSPASTDRAVVLRRGSFVRTARVQADGSYRLADIPPGSYRVTFDRVSGYAYAAPQFWRGQAEAAGSAIADRVHVSDGGVTSGVDAVLARGGSVQAVVRDASAQPLAGCLVQAYTADGRLVTRDGLSGADGRVTVAGLSSGSYLLRVAGKDDTPCKGLDQVVTSASGGPLSADPAAARPVVVTQGMSTELTQPLGYDTTASGSLSGHASLPGGLATPIDRTVVVRHGSRTWIGFVGDDGAWSVAGLPASTYRVTIGRVGGLAYTAATYLGGRSEGQGPDAGSWVTLAVGQQRGGVDLAPPVGGTLTGRLLDSDGDPLMCTLQAYDSGGRMVTRTGLSYGNPGKQPGDFVINGLGSGSYRVRVVSSEFGDCRSGQQVVTGGSVMSTGSAGAASFAVTVGRSRSIGSLVYARQAIRAVTPPVVAGTVEAGAVLTASPPQWSVTPDLISYAWSVDGVVVPGATTPRYELGASDVGKSIAVLVTATRVGWAGATVRSAAVGNSTTGGVGGTGGIGTQLPTGGTGTVTGGVGTTGGQPGGQSGGQTGAGGMGQSLQVVLAPELASKSVVGRRMAVVAAQLSPAATQIRYQWLRNGKVVQHATRAGYRPRGRDLGKRLAVRITYTRPGFVQLVLVTHAVRVGR